MPLGKTHPELLLAFHMGMTVKDLIKRGYAPNVVYNYHKKYRDRVKPAFDELLKMPLLNTEPAKE